MKTSTLHSPNHYPGHSGRSLIGIHTMEAAEAGNTAENVANYFAQPSTQASSHWCVDNDSRVRCVEDNDSAWTMPPTNEYSLNVEMAGYAGQSSSQWDDAYSNAMLDNAALCVAEWCAKYDIPARHLTDSQIANGEKGLAGHVDVNRVFQSSSHTDPGPHFPWDKFLGMINKHLGSSGSSKPPSGSSTPDCTQLQKAVRTSQDNMWGTETDKHCTAVIAASDFGGNAFPYGIAFTQQVVGTFDDGFWGSDSVAALKSTTANVQRALSSMGFNPGTVDGIWGPNTDKAYNSARTACHI